MARTSTGAMKVIKVAVSLVFEFIQYDITVIRIITTRRMVKGNLNASSDWMFDPFDEQSRDSVMFTVETKMGPYDSGKS